MRLRSGQPGGRASSPLHQPRERARARARRRALRRAGRRAAARRVHARRPASSRSMRCSTASITTSRATSTVDRQHRIWFADPRHAVIPFGPAIFPLLDHASVLRLERNERRAWVRDAHHLRHRCRRARCCCRRTRRRSMSPTASRARAQRRELRAYPIRADGSRRPSRRAAHLRRRPSRPASRHRGHVPRCRRQHRRLRAAGTAAVRGR